MNMVSADSEHPASGHGGAYRQPFTFEVAVACAGHPVRLARCLRLEAACFAAWPALEEERRGHLLLRAAGGYSMRINSGVPLVMPGAGVTWSEGHVRDAEAWFAARGLPPQFRLPEPLEGQGPSGVGGLDPVLASMGYSATDPTLVQELDIAGWPVCPAQPHHAARARPGNFPLPDRQCAIVDHATWLAAEGGLRGRTGADAVNPVLRGVLATLGPAGQTWLLRADGQPAVCGLGVRTGEDYGIFAVVARPDQRRQGHGRSLVSAMLHAARQDGARTAWLQVGQGNTPARALYEGLGFTTTYGYWYRVRR
ncbi:acetyltransferase family protein [Desulfovibrio sp. A2]|nr:acetyltransferase family protein [Desulfovibrio sp. A2]